MAAGNQAIKVAAICGSLRKASFNRGLIRSAIDVCNESIEGIQIEHIDISPLPLLNTDLEVKGTYPPAIEAFRSKILAADSILFASPENNYSFSGNYRLNYFGSIPFSPPINFPLFFDLLDEAPLKNAIDWASRYPNVWADKPAAIVSAGGGFGGGRSQYHLRQVGVFLDLHFINNPELFVPAFQPPRKFDDEGNLIDPEIKEKLKQLLLSLQAFTLRLGRKNA
ncbi:NADPH:quinone oxidoreductase [Platanthera zijinensis]|uniref:NAD(P)H dehydrogenase (quinone) n=1 Tax=Platanthera zijinensis TaxID=2320716 RepID=A0AAP0BLL3_9ASPA